MSQSAEKSSLLDGVEISHASNREQPKAAAAGSRSLGAIALALASILLLGYVGWSVFSSVRNSPTASANLVSLMDSESGEVIDQFSIPRGETFPYANPKTGKRTLYPVETCFWTKDGKAKFPPTYVILNERLGKPGPTTCPDCGRRVTVYNPTPRNDLMQAAWDASQKK